MPEIELKNQFLLEGVSEREFKTIIQQADASCESGVYKYYSGALKIIYNKKGNIQSIKGDPEEALVKIALRNVHEAVLIDHGIKIGRCIVFSSVPVTGWYRFENLLQFFPLSESSPYGPTIGHGDYPFVLEFSYPASSNNILDNERKTKRQHDLVQLLNLLFCWGANDGFGSDVQSWVRVPQSWTEEDGQRFTDGISRFIPSMGVKAMHLQIGYAYPDGFEIYKNTFTERDNAIGDVELINQIQYYGAFGVSLGEVLKLPDTMDTYLSTYIDLDANAELFNRSLHWFLLSSTVWHISHSLSYICLIQALETMCDSQPDSKQCDEDNCSNNIVIASKCDRCDKPVKVGGAVSSFKDFVERYAPGIPNKARNDIYTLRSALTHGSKLMSIDERHFGSFDRQTQDQRDLHYSARRLARVCLLNWLEEHKTK